MNPVGLFIYEFIADHTIEVKIDYIRPEYRDFKNAKFLYQKELIKLKDQGVSVMRTQSEIVAHQRYLKRMGFIEIRKNYFEKKV